MRSDIQRLYWVWFHVNEVAEAKEEELRTAMDRHVQHRAAAPSEDLIHCAGDIRLLTNAVAVAALRMTSSSINQR